VQLGMSALGQKRTLMLFDHLVGRGEQLRMKLHGELLGKHGASIAFSRL
jgi:hypothetical protein